MAPIGPGLSAIPNSVPNEREARLNEREIVLALIPLRRIAACPEADSLLSAMTPHVRSCRTLGTLECFKILQSLRGHSGSTQAAALLTALHKSIPERLHVDRERVAKGWVISAVVDLEHYFHLPIASQLIHTMLASVRARRLVGTEDLRDAASRKALVFRLLESRDSTNKEPEIDLHYVGHDEAAECVPQGRAAVGDAVT